MYLSGLDASKPAATAAKGYVYLASDTGAVYVSNGTAWIESGVFASGLDASKPTASAAKGFVYLATDTGAVYLSNGTAWSQMAGFASGLDASKPSASAAKGLFYSATDTGSQYLSNGSAWKQFLTLGNGSLTGVGATANVTATAGQLVLCQGGSGITVTLPAATTAGQLVGVVNYNNGANTVAGGGSLIYGEGAAGVSSIALGGSLSYAIFQSFASTWVIVSGQQDSGWQAASIASGFSSGGYGAAARMVGDRVWLRGTVTNNSGSTSSGVTVATIPSGLRPTTTIVPGYFLNSSLTSPTINTSGTITCFGGLGTGNTLYLDGMNYTLS
jgi:hypothetical protein